MAQQRRNYHSLPLSSFTCRPVNSNVIKITRRDLKLLTFISGHKIIFITAVNFYT
jgi:hypothetical protein